MKDALTVCYVCDQPLDDPFKLQKDSDGTTRRLCMKCYGRIHPVAEHIGGEGLVWPSQLTICKDFYHDGFEAGIGPLLEALRAIRDSDERDLSVYAKFCEQTAREILAQRGKEMKP